MNVAIYSRGVDLDQQQSLNDLIAELQKHDITIYIYADLIKKFNLVTGANKDAHFYICGWKNMVDEARATLTELGIPKSQIHFELYG